MPKRSKKGKKNTSMRSMDSAKNIKTKKEKTKGTVKSKANSTQPTSRKMPGTKMSLTKNNIDDVEKETLDKVDKTIMILENTLATWNVEKQKPEEHTQKFMRYKKIHDELMRWKREVVKSDKEDFETRAKRLESFVDICYTYIR
ncbi:hypothetical protein KKF81_07190 [Candidatus Micrarchaeota archaeon]|nr:hypothetical protein [Candidatus Micrarchaeota archaeon]MBU1166715.1 hypothetical protein [Candidatus Micrarchaeota archaeon]MBU1886646.1 hypothetical protein [Candidatus Micrarchaeota archaeon]